jgi:DNA-binding MarR family transcriptional regulator
MKNSLTSLISTFAASYRLLNKKLLYAVGIHPGQAQVLSVLWNDDGISQSEISRALEVSSPTVNLLVQKLEKSKFITSKKCKKDKRLMRVFLTKKGKDIRNDIELQWAKVEEKLFENFSDTEKVLGMMVIEKMKKNLQNE